MIPPFMRYLLFISLLCSTLLFSNEENITNCTDIEDPSERLNCYDSLFRKEEIREYKPDGDYQDHYRTIFLGDDYE